MPTLQRVLAIRATGTREVSTEVSQRRSYVIEERNAADDPANELSWKPIDATRVLLVQNPATPGEWEGDVSLTSPLAPGLMRVTLKEFEWYRTDDATSQDAPRTQIRIARRLVYADVFAL